ncbi:MAG: aminoglycoside phosphotransferase family protein [Actinobacteria bacterium]|nr:aminoglycoside phosphotransferase family protein [Actinomycetota bacterium]
MRDPDGSKLLTGDEVGNLLRTAVQHAGGVLQSWALDHIDANPQRSTTATYVASVEWPHGVRKELLGVSARAGGLAHTDERATIFADGDREVAVWIYPRDPDLPGLERAAYPTEMAAVLNEYHVFPTPVGVDQIRLDMIGYRPRRRAVLKCTVTSPARVLYVKVLRERLFESVKARHELLLEAGVPAPPILAATSDHLLVLDELPGRPLARAIFDEEPPTTAERLIRVLDAMPASVAELERRPPWSDAVKHYARMVSQAMPSLATRLDWMAEQISQGLEGCPEGQEPTHGDFHEGQIHVRNGHVSGILDIDTVGPGRRADDLACLVAHLSTVQRMNARQTERVHHLLRTWVPVFDERVDATELRLRAAAVIISLATGPYRSQEPQWERETLQIVDAAEALVRQVV